jgi:pantoate--beta-alanine ligase
MSIHTVTTVRELRQFVHLTHHQGKTIGLVPTMGALHEGHASLISRAAAECGTVIVSVFVNPTQFRPEEDFTRYPRTLATDEALCARHGAHLIFAPSVEEMYGQGTFAAGQEALSTFVHVPGLSEMFEGQTRPGHFRGVATVVMKLFQQTRPDRAYFGQKDAQQLAVIRRMVRELDVPVEIIGCPTVRAEDGLALSSRNAYLTPEQRPHAAALYRALTDARHRAQDGERDAELLRALMAAMIDDTPGCKLDYAAVVDPLTFRPLERIDADALGLLAVYLGKTRLIDNLLLTPETARA